MKLANDYSYEGRVVSAFYSDYLTEKFGNPEEHICGYTLHLLINKMNGKDFAPHCFEMQVYANYVIVDPNVKVKVYKTNEEGKEVETEVDKITYLRLTSPFYDKHGIPSTSSYDVSVGESYLSLRGETLRRKRKNEKDYQMNGGSPFCTIKRPLITDIWLPSDLDSNSESVECEPVANALRSIHQPFTNKTDKVLVNSHA